MTIPSTEGFLSAGSCLPCTPEEEKEIVSNLIRDAESNIKEGDLYYLISHRWWMDWKIYTGFDAPDEFMANSEESGPHFISSSRPGEIDNSKLVLDGSSNEPQLHRNLQEGQDYTLLPELVWCRLHEWYGGGPVLERRMILEGDISENYIVEVYPLSLELIDARDNSHRYIRVSRKATVGELYNLACSLLGVEQEKARIWDSFFNPKDKLLTDFDVTLVAAQLQMDQKILLEVEGEADNTDPSWPSSNKLALVPLEPATSSLSIAGGPALSNGGSHVLRLANYSQAERDLEDGYGLTLSPVSNLTLTTVNGGGGDVTEGRGLTGLHNLGNTCFMNSALQCLVHTPPLVEYFLDDYTEEINKDNPLGMQGELAVAFGDLLRKLWSAGRTAFAPRLFKSKLARFAPQFSGYNQHDSQELLAFLLDGLHEDLNRVKRKPYIEVKDSDGRPDHEFAEECWRNHMARNDSIIVDTCQGQYKSTLVCPVCSKVSVTFDPFMYLSLPLPSTVTRTMTVTVFSWNGDSLPMPFTVTVPKNGCSKDLLNALSVACCLKSSETLLLAEVYDHRIYRYIESPFESLFTIKDEEQIVAYRLPTGHEKLLRLEILHRRADRFESEPQYNINHRLIGTPLVTCIPPDSPTFQYINSAISSVLFPFSRTKTFPCPGNEKPAQSNSTASSGPSLDSIVLTDSERDPSSSNTDFDEDELDDDVADSDSPFFQLSLADEKGVSRRSIDRDTTDFTLSSSWNGFSSSSSSCNNSGGNVRLLMDWTDREMERYVLSYLEDLPEVFKHGYMSKKTRQEAVTLFSCLDAFLKEEPLGPDDMWYCPSCKEHRQATKKLDLWKLPEILVVHLKRFSYSRYLKNKLDTFVSFPIHDLDLSEYVTHADSAGPTSQHPHLYELYAVINHYGSLGGGHYSAYAKLVDEDRWYHFDDSHVSHVSIEDDVRTSAAYVLFYKRVKPVSSPEPLVNETIDIPIS